MKKVYYIDKISLVKEPSDFLRTKITDSASAAKFARNFYLSDISIFESVFILLLNNNLFTIGYAKISQGGTVGTVIDIKLIAKYALEGLAKSIILIHNHPSGTLIASDSDKKITNKVKKALYLFEIRLADHIILTEKAYSSMGDEGLI